MSAVLWPCAEVSKASQKATRNSTSNPDAQLLGLLSQRWRTWGIGAYRLFSNYRNCEPSSETVQAVTQTTSNGDLSQEFCCAYAALQRAVNCAQVGCFASRFSGEEDCVINGLG